MFNLARRHHVPVASVRNQCARDYLYGQDAELEKAIQKIEGIGANGIREVLRRDDAPPEDSPAHIELMTYTVMQFGRTPTAAAEMENLATAMMRRVMSSPGMLPEEARAHLGEVRMVHNDPATYSMAMALASGHGCLDLKCKLIANESPVEFVISDVGVVLHNQWCEGVRGVGTTGFASSGLQVFMPISPRRLLLFYDGSVYKVGPKRGRVVTFSDEVSASALNQLQCAATQENVYYTGHEQTRRALDRASYGRAPRDTLVRSRRAVEVGGRNELIVAFHEALPVQLALPWLSIQKRARAVSLSQRAHSWRRKARALDDLVRGPPERRYGPPPDRDRVFRAVDDDAEG